MPKKNRSNDSKDSAEKNTLNPTGGSNANTAVPSGPPPEGAEPRHTNEPGADHKIGQFTGRGSPGLQKK
jgi:hypothetical protein